MRSEKWDLLTLFTLYWDNQYNLSQEISYGAMLPTEKKDLKWLQFLFNAITGKQVDVELGQGRKEIREWVEHCFGQGDELCTEGQLAELQKILPFFPGLFEKLKAEKPKKFSFYYALWYTIAEGLIYLNIPGRKIAYPPSEKSVYDYKHKIDKHIIEHNKILVRAIVVLLGKEYGRKFTKQELFTKYEMLNI